MSRLLTFVAFVTATALSVAAQSKPRTKPVTDAEVARITRDAILIDTHDDVPSKTIDGYDIATPNKNGQTDLARLKGFLGAEFLAVYVDAEYTQGNHSANRALQIQGFVMDRSVPRWENGQETEISTSFLSAPLGRKV